MSIPSLVELQSFSPKHKITLSVGSTLAFLQHLINSFVNAFGFVVDSIMYSSYAVLCLEYVSFDAKPIHCCVPNIKFFFFLPIAEPVASTCELIALRFLSFSLSISLIPHSLCKSDLLIFFEDSICSSGFELSFFGTFELHIWLKLSCDELKFFFFYERIQ